MAGWCHLYSGRGVTDTTLRISDDLIAAAAPSDGNDSGEDEDAILLYTGGTTGRSKGVRLTHKNVFSNGQQCTAPMKINAADVYLHVAPMFHSADLLGTGYTQAGLHMPTCRSLPLITCWMLSRIIGSHLR